MFKGVLKAVFGDPNVKEIKKLTPLVEEVIALGPEMEAKSDEELREMLAQFRRELAETTAEQRQEVEKLRQAVVDKSGQERQRLQVQLEQQSSSLLVALF